MGTSRQSTELARHLGLISKLFKNLLNSLLAYSYI